MAKKDSSTMLNTAYCFTTTFNRPYHIYNCINNILNQNFSDILYSVNINIEVESDEIYYKKFLKDFEHDRRLHIFYSYNDRQHNNYLNAIRDCKDDDNGLYIKIDDDDIYHKNYISNAIEIFNSSNIDVLSSNINRNINNNKLNHKPMSSIGYWTGDDHPIKFGFPPTYCFNLYAKKIIENIPLNSYNTLHIFEDPVWRTFWRQNNVKSVIIDNDNFTYHIHGQNVSSSYLLSDSVPNSSLVDNQYCSVILFKHQLWESYVILNKRNNRCYHINNDSHGSFDMYDDYILVSWDRHGKETFYKTMENNNIFYKYN